ncbi:MAG: ATP-binding protein [Clostridia bacterium]|nr:ATP-binding protein [Clostridia bacterium]
MADSLFFGRKRQMNFLREKVFRERKPGYEIDRGYCCALRGPNGIGKTTMVNRLVREFKETIQNAPRKSTFIVEYKLKSGMTYYGFLETFFRQLMKLLTDDVLNDAPQYDDYVVECLLEYREMLDQIRKAPEITRVEESMLDDIANYFFEHTTELGIYFIIIFDEFERAMEAFPDDDNHDGRFFQTLWDYTPKAGADLLLSIIIISRRDGATIAHNLGSGSAWNDGFPLTELVLRGFDNGEMEEYYRSYGELPCGLLSNEVKGHIEFICGRHPGMLMRVREYIGAHYKAGDKINVREIWKYDGAGILTTYSRLLELLQSAVVDRNSGHTALHAFRQIYEGPAYDRNLTTQAQRLYDYGFVVANSDLADGAATRPAAGEADNYCGQMEWCYEPICENFRLYVRDNAPAYTSSEIGSIIENAEYWLRKFTETHMKAAYGDTWQDQINFTGFHENSWTQLQHNAWEFGATLRGVTVSKIEVLSIDALSSLLRSATLWPVVQPLLPSFTSRRDFSDRCHQLNVCRNCWAHGTLKILSESYLTKVRDVCDALTKDIESYFQTVLSAENAQSES